MKSLPIVPAEVDFSDPEAPRSPLFDDRYHSPSGAFEQASHVFLGGNDLPGRWRDRAAFTVLETGFGLGNNFLATWAAWHADARRPARLRFVSIEKHPLRIDDLRRALGASRAPDLAARLCDAWPPLTPDLHRLSFDDDRVELLLAFGDAAAWLREIVASVDAFYLDGFAPASNPDMWSPSLFKALSRLAAPGATAATWSSARPVRDGLRLAGFDWRKAEGIGGKREISLATFAPRVLARPPVARVARGGVKRVAIIGGGLAGASAARALAREGLHCTVFDGQVEPASGASGNVAGLFHGVFHPDDGMHARAHRAAALMAQPDYRQAIAQGVAGACDGLLRLAPAPADVEPMRVSLERGGLPPDYLQAWSAQRVCESGGPPCPAWFYPGGGWISPAALVRSWLETPGIEWRGGVEVARLERTQDETPPSIPGSTEACRRSPTWRLFDASGRLLADVDAVVFANAGHALASWATAGMPGGRAGPADERWIPPLVSTRGQVGIVAADTPGLRAPALPIAGAGYALTLADGAVMCGATTAIDDDDPALRLADHAHNLRQLAAVTTSALTAGGGVIDGRTAEGTTTGERVARALVEQGRLHGRVGWRATAVDRLPLIGGVPMQPPFVALAALPDQPRHWPRVPGLFIVAGFGSRGLTWAPLAGRLIVSWITGAPYPLPADLVDALDPARFATRAVRVSHRPGDEARGVDLSAR